ncbi:MAG: MFS transporter [Devosia sp.]
MDRATRIRAVFFIHAIASGGLYTRMAQIQDMLHVDAATLGLAFLGFPLGSMIMLQFGSRLLEAVGTRRILLFTLPLLPAGTALLTIMPTATALFFAFMGYALFYSLPNMAMNIEADRVEASSTRRVMNSCHGVWSIGYLLATLIGTLAVALHLSPIEHLGLLAVPIVPFAYWIIVNIDPAPPRPHTAQVVRRLSLPTLAVWLLVAFTLGPNMLEGALRNWSVIYMRDSFAAPSWVDTLTLPVFLLAQSIGRLNADTLVTRYGPVRVARGLNISAFFGCLLVTLAPNLYVALAGFLCVGIGVCASYPLTTSAAARLGDRPSSQNVASLTLAVQLIMLASPAALGWVATNLGIRLTFGVILPAILLSQWLARYLAPKPAA